MKKINLDLPVANLVEEYPELKNILTDLGFTEIVNPTALSTVGKVVTLKKGSLIKNIDLGKIVKKLEDEGFEVLNSGINSNEEENILEENLSENKENSKEDRLELLKSYIQRLSQGQDLEEVREDFVKNFKDVSSKEIMEAEQSLILGGVPLEKVQKLCDIHSALFHDQDIIDQSGKDLEKVPGHPLNILSLENKEIKNLVENIKNSQDKLPEIKKLLAINSHYSKKAGLIYPLLKTKYKINGPSDVMWGVDDEIRKSLSQIVKSKSYDEKDLEQVLNRVEEMIYKEENILFPILKDHFTEDEWNKIYADLNEYGLDLLGDIPIWKDYIEKEKIKNENSASLNFETGSLTAKEAIQIFRTIDAELTFIDKDDIVRYYSEGENKIFPRPKSCLGRDVTSCHPPKVVPIVKNLLEDFKNKKRDRLVVCRKIKGRDILVKYLAIYDNGNYIGTLETVEDISEYK